MCTAFYFTPCPVPSCPTYEPNSNDCEYSQPFRHIQYKRTPSFRPIATLAMPSVLLTGKIPLIIDAFRLVPVGKLTGLRKVRLGGEVEVDPKIQDLFRTLIEQRKSLSRRKEL